jgi:peptidoglycan hydrolase CwlO-like protein
MAKHPTMEDILKSNLEKHKELKDQAIVELQEAKRKFKERIEGLDSEIQKIKNDLERTDGDNYPKDGEFFPPQNW